MEYYSALKRRVILTATASMNLESSMLKDISQTQKDRYCVTVLI